MGTVVTKRQESDWVEVGWWANNKATEWKISWRATSLGRTTWDDSEKTTTSKTTSGTYIVHGLEPGTKYRFKVQRKKDGKWKSRVGEAITTTPSLRNENSDVYPGDAAFQTIVQKLLHEFYDGVVPKSAALNIGPTGDADTMTQAQVAGLAAFVLHHAAFGIANDSTTHAAILDQLTTSPGYATPADWAPWVGAYKRYSLNQAEPVAIDEGERIRMVRGVATPTPDVLNGQPYAIQNAVIWRRHHAPTQAWLMSHSDVDYVWGWDPGHDGNHGGWAGARVGLTFVVSGVHGIVWMSRSAGTVVEVIGSQGPGQGSRAFAGPHVEQWLVN